MIEPYWIEGPGKHEYLVAYEHWISNPWTAGREVGHPVANEESTAKGPFHDLSTTSVASSSLGTTSITRASTTTLEYLKIASRRSGCPNRSSSETFRQGPPAEAAGATSVKVNHRSRKRMGSNGEVEGPDDHAVQATRAHTVRRRPRRQARSPSRTPPTIVRRHGCHSKPSTIRST